MTAITYGQLDKLLSSLGFSVRLITSAKKVRVYKHEQSGALVPLAFLPDSRSVLPHHLAAVRGTLDVYGIADPLDFAAKVQKVS